MKCSLCEEAYELEAFLQHWYLPGGILTLQAFQQGLVSSVEK